MADELTIEQSERYEGDDWWRWAVWVEGSDAALDQIDFVEWTLHPTFPNPIRKVRDRASKFRLETGGWGVFQIFARLQMTSGEQRELKHFLRLHYPDGAQATA